jgi:hypothetical protein
MLERRQKRGAITRDLERMGDCTPLEELGAKVYAKGWYTRGAFFWLIAMEPENCCRESRLC